MKTEEKYVPLWRSRTSRRVPNMAAVVLNGVSDSSRNVENISVIETSGHLYNDQPISDIHALNNEVKFVSDYRFVK